MGLINANSELSVVPAFGIFVIETLLSQSTYLQNSNNYYIKTANENSFEGFELFYKKKKANIIYKIESDQKFAFGDDMNKLSYLSYDDLSKMGGYHKISNYKLFGTMINDLWSFIKGCN